MVKLICRPIFFLAVAIIAFAPPNPSWALGWRHTDSLDRINRRLHGQLVDHTHNSGRDCRIWSAALNQRRDLYVYLPPGFNPQLQYPLVIWLHGFGQDEQSFRDDVVERIDCAIATGKLPPMIVVAPDGSLTGEPHLRTPGSFFLNTKAGAFEDFLVQDVWNFVVEHYPIRPEREAHVLAGVSMGGGAAYNLAMKYRDRFKVVIGISPPLNSRWLDCHGRYMRNFDPCCWDWRTDFSRGRETVGRFYFVVKVHLKDVVDALYDRGPQTAGLVSQENPIEMIDRLALREGELSMYVGYGGKDQFNIDAQVESFLYRTRQRGLTVAVGYEPRGKHDQATAVKLFPGVIRWLGPQLTPYAPLMAAPPH